MTLLERASGVGLRRADYALSDEQRALRAVFASLLERECPTDRVRAAEPLGFDAGLWQRFVDLDAVGMGLSVEAGGAGAGLVELALVAEQVGRFAAPVPFVEAAVAARLLERCGPDAAPVLGRALTGGAIVTLALRSASGRPQLVPAGAVAQSVVGRVGDGLVIVSEDVDHPLVRNHATAPLGAWNLASSDANAIAVASGETTVEAHTRSVREWKLLMSAALVGLAEGALTLGVAHAQEREAFGAPIGTFQAVSHPLVDCHIAVVGARRLVWKAAWFADHHLGAEPQLVPMAYTHACRTAIQAATVAVHTLGGLGVTLESDAQLFFRRAKGWPNVAGDPSGELQAIADALYGTAT